MLPEVSNEVYKPAFVSAFHWGGIRIYIAIREQFKELCRRLGISAGSIWTTAFCYNGVIPVSSNFQGYGTIPIGHRLLVIIRLINTISIKVCASTVNGAALRHYPVSRRVPGVRPATWLPSAFASLRVKRARQLQRLFAGDHLTRGLRHLDLGEQ